MERPDNTAGHVAALDALTDRIVDGLRENGAELDTCDRALVWNELSQAGVGRTPPAEVAGMVEEAERLDREATPGPWIDGESDTKQWLLVASAASHRAGVSPVIARLKNEVNGSPPDAGDYANAAFIARTRTLLPALAKALRAAKPAGDAWRREPPTVEEVRAEPWWRLRPVRTKDCDIRKLVMYAGKLCVNYDECPWPIRDLGPMEWAPLRAAETTCHHRTAGDRLVTCPGCGQLVPGYAEDEPCIAPKEGA